MCTSRLWSCKVSWWRRRRWAAVGACRELPSSTTACMPPLPCLLPSMSGGGCPSPATGEAPPSHSMGTKTHTCMTCRLSPYTATCRVSSEWMRKPTIINLEGCIQVNHIFGKSKVESFTFMNYKVESRLENMCVGSFSMCKSKLLLDGHNLKNTDALIPELWRWAWLNSMQNVFHVFIIPSNFSQNVNRRQIVLPNKVKSITKWIPFMIYPVVLVWLSCILWYQNYFKVKGSLLFKKN